jgi:photosystem II stability/assembly factor-like uncharacterized protein
MKSKLARIWGVGLVLVLMVGLLAWSAPIAADTLEWDDEDIPDDGDYIILSGEDVVTMDVSEAGLVVYAGTGDGVIYVSTDKGVTWDDSAAPTAEGVVVEHVAVSPDDPKYIAVTGDGDDVIISDDGGATFDSLGSPNIITDVIDLAVSRESDDNRWIAVAGSDGTEAVIEYYEIGAIGADWIVLTQTGTDIGSGFTEGDADAVAIAFSPNFHSDEMLVAVTANGTANTIDVQLFHFNKEEWNADAGLTDFPVDTNVDSDAFATADALSVALSPDYLGSDDDLRLAFVGVATDTEGPEAGIFRLENDDVEVLEDETNINSVAFDGSNLLAGGFLDTEVYRSDNPTASDPDVDDTSSMKAPGGDDTTIVGWAGDIAVAATSGDGSCFSNSRNNGASFHDISLIDSDLETLSDVAVSMDGETVYLVTYDSTYADLSLWRMGEDQEADWERVLYDNGANAAADFIVRVAPDDPNVVFLADLEGSTIYYSTDAGESRWRTRASRYDVGDLAVEGSGEVLYVLEDNASACYVSRSDDTGFTWDGRETTGLSQGASTIISLAEDELLVGSAEGTVSMSTDGGSSWTDLEDTMDPEGAVQVTASGLNAGDFIYAVTDAGENVYRWEIGEDDSWDDFYDEVTDDAFFYGIFLSQGTLYALASGNNGTDNFSELYRFIDPTDGDVSIETASLEGLLFDKTPSSLRANLGSTNLWALGTDDQGADALYAYEDTIALAGPTLKGPSNGFTVPVNEISGDTADVNFSWKSPSDEITLFDLEIAVDDEFDEVVFEFGDDERDEVGDGDEGDTMSFTMTDDDYDLMPGVTYYWRVRVNEAGPVESPWSDAWSFTVTDAEAVAPVAVQPAPPAPEITVEVPPAPAVTLPAPVVQVPEIAPAIPTSLLWAVVVIGAILVIALIVLIVRTRKVT